jgi:hypothetical protein
MGDRLMGYNGWKNYATWNVNLWVMNDESIYRAWQMMQRHYTTFTARSAYATARGLFGEKTPDDVPIDDPAIDWEEIANAWNED